MAASSVLGPIEPLRATKKLAGQTEGAAAMTSRDRMAVMIRGIDCETCFAEMKSSPFATGFDRVGSYALVPPEWLTAECSHGRRGVSLEPVERDNDGVTGDGGPIQEDQAGPSTASIEDQKSFQQSRWRELFPDGLDATKGIGYPAREVGRYGSHPQHDGSDDE